MKIFLSALSFFIFSFHTQARAQDFPVTSTLKDSTTQRSFLKRGQLYGQSRSYVAATINQKELIDYIAWGVGAGIGYKTPVFLGHLQAGISGHFIFNLASTELDKPESTTNQINRYEVGLFDVQHPGQKAIYRPEDLFLRLKIGNKSSLTVGRQLPHTPFVNPQDGRIRPTLIEAAVLDWKGWKSLTLHGEYIWRMSPRSTARWYGVGDTFGIYPSGVDLSGKPAQYKGQVQTKGIGIAGLVYQKNQWDIQAWNTYVDNVLNTFLLKTEWKSNTTTHKNWIAGAQLILQNSVGNGGNADAAKAYTLPGRSAMVFSGRFGRQSPQLDWYVNATRITAEGRYLMPREWGREPFYTFLPRERNEGTGDVTAATFNTIFKPKKNLKLEMSGGVFKLPDVKKYALNKYGLPAYAQLNMGATYQFSHSLKGLEVTLLVVRKNTLGETYQNDRYVFNKVNMTHANFILTHRY